MQHVNFCKDINDFTENVEENFIDFWVFHVKYDNLRIRQVARKQTILLQEQQEYPTPNWKVLFRDF